MQLCTLDMCDMSWDMMYEQIVGRNLEKKKKKKETLNINMQLLFVLFLLYMLTNQLFLHLNLTNRCCFSFILLKDAFLLCQNV